MLVVVSILGTVTVTMLQRVLVKNLDDELVSSGTVVANQILKDSQSPHMGDDAAAVSDYYVYLYWWNSQTMQYQENTQVSTSVSDRYGEPAGDQELLETLTTSPTTILGTSDSPWRAVVFDITNQNQTTREVVGKVLIAKPLKPITQIINLVTQTVILISVVIVTLGAAATAAFVRHSLNGLRAIERVTYDIAAGDLSQRVPRDKDGSEVANLADSINIMLSQIEQAFVVRLNSEKKMRQFVSDASHELRTPLATVRGYSELYRIGGVPAENLPQTMNRIESEATRMSGLVEDLLQLARLDEGRPLSLGPVNLTEVCENAVADFHVRDANRSASVIGLTRPETEPVVVTADSDKVAQVVANLLSNVLTHTPDGTPCEVAVGMASDDEAVIEVRDHGPGVSDEDASRIFERFYRADYSRSRASGGSGLGMAIVAAIMASHGGSARVATTPGGGLTVRLSFPVTPPADTAR
ncbi:HAMP domain-containing histidine kinase [Arcanobacterium haemolyticum]|nr:HAMP domain-containing histidine kinase [Arcanobacterium haemolyticum]